MVDRLLRSPFHRSLAVAFLAPAILALGSSSGEETRELESVSWTDSRWRIAAEDSEVEAYLGRTAMKLENGTAWLDGVSLRDGVLEVDLAVPDALGFHGFAFRATDDDDYEHVYVRSHLGGDPDASQYTPVFNGVSGWQIYTGPGFTAPVDLVGGRWMHLRLAFRDQRAELSIDGQPVPIPHLERSVERGGIALTSSGTAARFANLTVHRDAPDLGHVEESDAAPVTASPPPGTVTRWRVSSSFPEERLSASDPRADGWRDLEWKPLDTTVRGIANLAMLGGLDPSADTVFAAVTVRVREAGALPVRFGFSDRVQVLLDGRVFFRGNDGWRSRDHRFLGTIGLHDELVLPLEAGEHELWFAVSESFGGWGVAAQIPVSSGVVVVEPTVTGH